MGAYEVDRERALRLMDKDERRMVHRADRFVQVLHKRWRSYGCDLVYVCPDTDATMVTHEKDTWRTVYKLKADLWGLCLTGTIDSRDA